MNRTFKISKAHRAFFLTALILTLHTQAVFGVDTGWRFPKQASVAAGSDWKGPDDVVNCDGVNSYYVGLNTEDTLFASNYAFSLPISAIIDSLWYKYTGYGSGDGEENIIQIGFMAGASRNLYSEFHLSSVASNDSAGLTVFSRDTINVTCVNSNSFGLYVITAGDELLTHTYIDCMVIRIFYHNTGSLLRRQKLIKMED